MANRLIQQLKDENNLTIERLKHLFRKLCKETHPDLTRMPDADFIRLRQDYEEAIRYLTGGKPPEQSSEGFHEEPVEETPPEDPRLEFFEQLYAYTTKLFGSEGERSLHALIKASKYYREELYQLFQDYYEAFFKKFEMWKLLGRVFEAHGVLIRTITLLLHYYHEQSPRQKSILLSYFHDLDKRAKWLPEKEGLVLLNFVIWLREEAENERIDLF